MNLDRMAFQHAEECFNNIDLQEDLEKAARRAVSVLLEQGLYATLLYLHTKEKTGPKIAGELIGFSKELFTTTQATDAAKKQLRYLTETITHDNDRILMVRKIWEDTLNYVIYYNKL